MRIADLLGSLALAAAPAWGQLWIYQDGLASGWQDWSWNATLNFNCTNPVHSGTRSVSAELGAWGAISLHHTALGRTNYGALEFQVRGSAGNTPIWLYLQDDGSGQSSDAILLNNAAYLPDGTLATGAWKKALVRLSAFPNAPASFTRINWFNNDGGAQAPFYLDTIRLTGADELPPELRAVHAESRTVAAGYFDQPLDTNSLPHGCYMLWNAADPHYTPAVTGVFAYYRADLRGVAADFPYPFGTAGVYQLTITGITNSGGLALASVATGRFALTSIGVQINATADLHRISPYIYGLAFGPGTQYLRGAGITVNRSGGNRRSKYNWRLGASNTGADWYYENVGEDSGPAGEESGLGFALRNSAAGCATLMTLPTLGWVAKDRSSYSYSIAKYGPQDDADYTWRPDAGNGLRNGSSITNDPRDALVPSRPFRTPGDPADCVYQDEWLQALRKELGPLAEATLTFIAMDNEPDGWRGTHQDAHPLPPTYDELLDQFLVYATMTRSNWPEARITGPVSLGWWFYWNSDAGWGDKAAHDNQDFLPWFLDRVRAHDTNAGQRTLNVLDIHYYPTGIYNNNTDTNTRALRLRATRSFWDPSYRDEGWIGSDTVATQTQPNRNYVQLIPRFKALLTNHYPGTRLGITEWSMGGENDISGGLAIADVLGIFGREDLYLANYWATPDTGAPAYQAFKLYGNYDGQGARFPPFAIRAASSDQGRLAAYAGLSPAGDRLALIMVNKEPDCDILAMVRLEHFAPGATATVYALDALDPTRLLQPPVITHAAPEFEAVFHAYSATLLVLTGPAVDSDTNGLPDTWQRAYPVSGPATDDDGDGASNLDEYRADTDPLDSNSVLRLQLHRGATNWWLGLPSMPGRTYRLEAAAQPGTTWQTNGVKYGNGAALLWNLLPTTSTGVYRGCVLE